ncbi:hypothetical protein R6Q59_014296 [Mikania micrantha]
MSSTLQGELEDVTMLKSQHNHHLLLLFFPNFKSYPLQLFKESWGDSMMLKRQRSNEKKDTQIEQIDMLIANIKFRLFNHDAYLEAYVLSDYFKQVSEILS